MRRPNFLICGAAQSGTSSLADSLAQHPQIYMPKRTTPEPHFFLKSWEYENGFDTYLNTWFSEVENEIAIGEKSSSYMFGGPIVAERIVYHIPDVRLIFILRDPVERTWAHYRFTVLNGLETLSFDDALMQEDERVGNQVGRWAEIQPYNYTGRGAYASQLSAFYDFFGPHQILVLKAESFRVDRRNQFEKIFEFLEVDPNFEPQEASVFTSWEVKDAATQAKCREIFGERFAGMLRMLRSSADLSEYARNRDEQKMIELLVRNVSETKLQMSTFSRTYLTEKFRDECAALTKVVNFSIDDWASMSGSP